MPPLLRLLFAPLFWALPLVFLVPPTAHAATASRSTGAAAAAASAAESKSIMTALTKAHAAVVGVRVTAVDGARSTQTLGINRRGSGVVIGSNGLILTIGYLLLRPSK